MSRESRRILPAVLLQVNGGNRRSFGTLPMRVPRYFFHLYNDDVVCDEEGQDLADLEEAHRVAVANAIEMATASVRAGELNLEHRIDVADEDGAVVCTVHFRDVVNVKD